MDAKLELRLARINELKLLDKGWLDGSGEKIFNEAIEKATEFLYILQKDGFYDWQLPYIYPTEDGNIQFEWFFDQFEVTAKLGKNLLLSWVNKKEEIRQLYKINDFTTLLNELTRMHNACNKCGGRTRTVLSEKRMLQNICNGDYEFNDEDICNWKSDLYLPKTKNIDSTKEIYLDGWKYELFDRYGQTCVYSVVYKSQSECENDAKKSLELHNKIEGYGPCKVVIWPPSVTVVGKVIE